MSLFSKNLRFLRKRANLMQEDIARLFRKGSNTIGNWENGKSEPSLAGLLILADFFQVTIQEMLSTDLEIRAYSPASHPVFMSPVPGDDRPEQPAGGPQESSEAVFRIILLELKALKDKVDLLSAAIENGRPKNNSDKSYH